MRDSHTPAQGILDMFLAKAWYKTLYKSEAGKNIGTPEQCRYGHILDTLFQKMSKMCPKCIQNMFKMCPNPKCVQNMSTKSPKSVHVYLGVHKRSKHMDTFWTLRKNVFKYFPHCPKSIQNVSKNLDMFWTLYFPL